MFKYYRSDVFILLVLVTLFSIAPILHGETSALKKNRVQPGLTNIVGAAPASPSSPPPVTSASASSDKYAEFLERVNQQLSMTSGNYQTLFTILGVITGVLGVALTLATIIITWLLWRQSTEFKKMAETERKEYFRRFDEVLADQKKKFEERHAELKVFKESWNKEFLDQISSLSEKLKQNIPDPAKEEIKSQIQQIQNQMRVFEVQVAASASATPAVVIPEPRSGFGPTGATGPTGWTGSNGPTAIYVGSSIPSGIVFPSGSSHLKKCKHCGTTFAVSGHSALSIIESQCPNCQRPT